MDRRDLIEELRKQKKTFREIGGLLGITHQRVHQILAEYKVTPLPIRAEVKQRDENKCALCDSVDNLEVHHINGLKRDNNLDNLVTLCRKCHRKIEKGKKKNHVKKTTKIKKLCSVCGKEFEIFPSFLRQKTCSKKCGTISQRKWCDKPHNEMTEEEWKECNKKRNFTPENIARRKRYYQKNKKKLLERNKTPEAKKYFREYYQRNRKKILLKNKNKTS